MKKISLFCLLICAINYLCISQCSDPEVGENFYNCGVTAQLNVANATTGYWEAFVEGSPYPSVVYIPDNVTHTVEATILGFGVEHYLDVVFVWTDDSGPCIDELTVKFVDIPVATIVGDEESFVCGNTIELTADTSGYGWAGGGAWFSNGVIGSFSDYNNPDTQFSFIDPAFGDSAYVSVQFIWLMNFYGCTSKDTVWVDFYQNPEANAGIDNAVCGNQMNIEAEILLEETSDYTPSWNWSVYLKPLPEADAVINPIYGTMSEITVSHNGIWYMILTEFNSNNLECFNKDTVLFDFVAIPEVYAGEDFDICGNCISLNAAQEYFSGEWLPNGCGFVDYQDENTEACCNTYGYHDFVRMGSNSSWIMLLTCYSRDTVRIGLWKNPSPNILNEPDDSVECGLTFSNLMSENPSSMINGHWYSSAAGVEFEDANNTNTSVTVPTYSKYDFYWVEQSGPESNPSFCVDSAGPFELYFIERAEVFAGDDDYVYGNDYVLHGEVFTDPNLHFPFNHIWVDDYAVNFESYTSTVTGINVLNFGTYEIVFIVSYDGVIGCSGKDTVKITFIDPIYMTDQNVELNHSDVDIFPNPAKDIITIQSEFEISEVYIYDVNGRLVLSPNESNLNVDVSELDSGVYFIKAIIQEKTLVYKFIKQ